jgi:hypothetical protein
VDFVTDADFLHSVDHRLSSAVGSTGYPARDPLSVASEWASTPPTVLAGHRDARVSRS